MKNIGKPCAGKLHARFDEGGQARACSLLYPLISLIFWWRWGWFDAIATPVWARVATVFVLLGFASVYF